MVAIGGIADIVQHWHEMARSRIDPKRTFSALFDHLVGERKEGGRNFKTQHLRRLEVDE
jgi:hypothetical protein